LHEVPLIGTTATKSFRSQKCQDDDEVFSHKVAANEQVLPMVGK